ncbi:hypothetical protein [Amycolatopsis samaneae]|uniref:Uncharacterized protein n=1 Tax=Amycolatopsis samaneae TaxID=664691 RepID=A0ABW5GBW5_9PSEU
MTGNIGAVAVLAREEIRRTDWESLPVMGDRSKRVPGSIAGLLLATSNAEAERYYWELENCVVVQGQLFEAAPAVVPVLLAALVEGVSPAAKPHVLELLFQLVAGEADEEAAARGNPKLGDECRARAREGLWILYGELGGKFDYAARDILDRVEVDRDRFSRLTGAFPQGEYVMGALPEDE